MQPVKFVKIDLKQGRVPWPMVRESDGVLSYYSSAAHSFSPSQMRRLQAAIEEHPLAKRFVHHLQIYLENGGDLETFCKFHRSTQKEAEAWANLLFPPATKPRRWGRPKKPKTEPEAPRCHRCGRHTWKGDERTRSAGRVWECWRCTVVLAKQRKTKEMGGVQIQKKPNSRMVK